MIEPLRDNRSTLREHYRRKLQGYDRSEASRYDQRLRRIFGLRYEHPGQIPAATFVRQVRPQLHRLLVRRSHLHPYLVHHVMRMVIRRARELDLCVAGSLRVTERELFGLLERILFDLRAPRPGALRPVKKLRVLVLMHESLVPPASLEGYTEQQINEFKTEYDVMTFLRNAGHEVRALGLYDNLADLRAAITEWKPDIAFNLLQEFQGIVTYDQHIVAYLELMRQPYTGCNPRGMMLSRDKVLSKQILSYHRIATPQFLIFRRGHPYRLSRKLKFPLFVKSATEDASLGIAQASIVEDRVHLKERIDFIHDNTKTDALVEEYIEGRELYVSVCGNDRLTTFPVWEMDFGTLPERQRRHRHAQGEVGPQVPEEARHQDQQGAWAHRCRSRAPWAG